MIYFDTSYLAKLYLDEEGAPAVVAWAESKGDFVCAAHGRLELFATFKRKQREAALTAAQLAALVRVHEEDETSGLVRWLPLDATLIHEACARLAKLPPAVFLRAADALHLASAAMCGYQVVPVACDANGNIEIADLRAKAAAHAADLAALMVTYPSTHGVFESSIKDICAAIHSHGGQVYMDGANMNAQVGMEAYAETKA